MLPLSNGKLHHVTVLFFSLILLLFILHNDPSLESLSKIGLERLDKQDISHLDTEQYIRDLTGSLRHQERKLGANTCGNVPQQNTGVGQIIDCRLPSGCNYTNDRSTLLPGWVYTEYYTGSSCSGRINFVEGYATGSCMPLLNPIDGTTLIGSMTQYCAGLDSSSITVIYYSSFNCDPSTITQEVFYPVGGCYQPSSNSQNALLTYGTSLALRCTKSNPTNGGIISLPLQQDAIVYSGYGVGRSCSSSIQATTFRAFPKQSCSSNPVKLLINSSYLVCPDRSTTYQFSSSFGQACSAPNNLSASSLMSSTCQTVSNPAQLLLSSKGGAYDTLFGISSSTSNAGPTTCQASCNSLFRYCMPTGQPTSTPTRGQSLGLTSRPSSQPSSRPSTFLILPTAQPSRFPSSQPSHRPSMQPSRFPSMQPISKPSRRPSSQPSTQPSNQPTHQPSKQVCPFCYCSPAHHCCLVTPIGPITIYTCSRIMIPSPSWYLPTSLSHLSDI